MEYTFRTPTGTTTTVRCPMSEIARVTAEVREAWGWERVFTPPRFHLYPNFHEAIEEVQGFHRENVEVAARGQREAQELIAQGLKEEGYLS